MSIFLEFGLLIFTFLIPLSQDVSIRVLILIAILTLFNYSPHQTIGSVLRTSWDLLVYMAILLVGIIYSNDLKTALRVVETSISCLLLPIVYGRISPSTRNVNFIYLLFVIGLFLSSLICTSYSAIRYNAGSDVSVFFFEEFTKGVGMQPTYMAYYLCFALTISLYYLYYEKTDISILWQIIIQFAFFIALMLTEGRTAYVSMLFIFSFFILKFLFEEVRVSAKRVAFIISVIFMLSMLIINHYNFNAISSNVNGDYWERLILWKSAISANVNYFFGVGTGDYKYVLNEYYKAQGMNQYAEESYNSHNQFIQLFFSNGILGLLSLIGMIARPLYLSFKVQNSLGILIMFPFIIYGMTEVFLGRYQGVVFFVFCHQITIFQYYITRPELAFKST